MKRRTRQAGVRCLAHSSQARRSRRREARQRQAGNVIAFITHPNEEQHWFGATPMTSEEPTSLAPVLPMLPEPVASNLVASPVITEASGSLLCVGRVQCPVR
jgi:hypothetical protein